MDEFIDKAVKTLRKRYSKKMLKDKVDFFESLIKGLTAKEFYQIIKKTWKDRDIEFMNNALNELYEKVDTENKADIKEKTIVFYKLVKNKRFDEIVDKYIKDVMSYYETRHKIAEKVPEKLEYLQDFVDKYDEQVSSVPYFNKDGTIHSWHTLEDYAGMVFNTNLTRAAWNRSLTDAEYLNIDELYLPAHPFACKRCMEWQGKFYSKSGKGKYPDYHIAIKGGIGHPRCRHVFVPVHDEEMQEQKEKYNSPEWARKYEGQQKLNAINNKALKFKNDLKTQKQLNDPRAEKTKVKIKKLREKYDEVKTEYDL